jgi:hypothetical protein
VPAYHKYSPSDHISYMPRKSTADHISIGYNQGKSIVHVEPEHLVQCGVDHDCCNMHNHIHLCPYEVPPGCILGFVAPVADSSHANCLPPWIWCAQGWLYVLTLALALLSIQSAS